MFVLYLKSLEIQGFKSFPAQTRLTFDKPITAIVGPNGSGKSNIADAILWVMGEQSTKTLRGGKMEDVIFGGTLRRPSQNFAEVSLILDNTEGDLGLDTTEVMLTRRYYRSGESEYYINRSIVRLKEITELFMDTGLGREGYSVIGQGRISEILSAKSKDRRDIFEEAAGISRYRHRKDEAERKLAQTDENLVRIGDRISELELQVEPLREQAEIAKKYNLLSGELRGIEISLWLKELETIGARTEKVENDYLDADRKLAATQVELDELFAQSDSLSEMTAQSDKEAQAIRELKSDFENKCNEADNAIAVLKTQLEGNSGQIENLEGELKSGEEQHDGMGEQISNREKRLEEIAESKADKEKQIDLLIKEFEGITDTTGASEEKHRGLIKKEQTLQSEHSDRKSELSALASTAQELYDMEESVKQELAGVKQDLKQREDEHKRENAELEKAGEEAASLENVIKGLALKAENRAKKAQESGETLERLSFEVKTLEARQTLLSDMEKEYQGYSESVKKVMQESSRGTLKNIHGTVGSLVKTDDSFTIAIETALGGALQNIIVGTEEDGKAAINFLMRRSGGRATFLPISTVKGKTLSESEFSGDDGFVGLAIDLVKFDAKYAGIYANLLGRVIVSEDLTSAINTAKKHGHKYKIVTLDGQVMNVGGSMTGGSAARTVGVLSRANELSSLDVRIKTCIEEKNKAEREHSERLRERAAAEYELSTAEGQQQTIHEELLKMELEKTHREQNMQTLKGTVKTLTEQAAAIENRNQENSKNTDTLKADMQKLEAELETVKADIEEATKGHEILSRERERVNASLSELRSEISALDAEREASIKAVTELRGIRDEISGSRQRQAETINGLKTRNEEICKEIAEKEREASAINKEITSQNERLTSLNNRKLEIEAKRGSINKTIKDKTDEQSEKQRKVSSLEVKKQSIKNEEDMILERLWTTYELSRSAAVNHGTPIESVTSARKRINAIKREVDELGTPNLGAIKEYERISERYEFYSSQRSDIQKAKTELLGIIEELTSHMRDIFSREFNIINESFKRTFRELFGGGMAALILEDPEDVLGCGIEIEVQPPGKSLKTITLLSGGEKAFVAIAIYFAILSVRPPPFVVMDEIDAALDDANVRRFSDYMRFMSDKSQMIVITHKRGTMEEADVLYGITMQELGVSNLLCINLDEAEKHMRSKVSA